MHEIQSPRIQPDTRRLASANPDLVQVTRDSGLEFGGLLISIAGLAPEVRVGDGTLATVPDVKAVDVGQAEAVKVEGVEMVLSHSAGWGRGGRVRTADGDRGGGCGSGEWSGRMGLDVTGGGGG